MADMEGLAETARWQLGLLARRQALTGGLTDGMIHRRVRRGELVVVRPGVYASPFAPRTRAQALLAVVLAAGLPAWISHRTAAVFHGLPLKAPSTIDVLTPPGRSVRLDGVVHHRSGILPDADLTRVGGVPVTSVGRTLLDCTRWMSQRQMGRAVDDACRRRLLTYEELRACHERLDRGRRTGRRLVVPARPVVADRMGGRLPGGSEHELDVLEILGSAGRELPVQQHRVVVRGKPRVLDYAFVDDMVALEWDGFAEHGLIRSTFDDDRDRDNELRLAGWIVLHFTSNTTPSDLVRWVDEARAAAARRCRSA